MVIIHKDIKTGLSELLTELLVCPVCKGDLTAAMRDHEPTLACPRCRLSYPIEEGIPVMLVDQARPLA
jgi:uncharacterized protein YbaR (Trm112 family)